MRITIITTHSSQCDAIPVKKSLTFLLHTLLALSAGFSITDALAADDTFNLTIKDHRFEPAQLDVPAGKKLKLIVKNLDPTPEEFESRDLKREKVIAGKGQATISIGPLKPGAYEFVGEFHESTAKGQIVAK
jgi:plastocyanin